MLCLAGNENRAISTTYEIQPSKSGILGSNSWTVDGLTEMMADIAAGHLAPPIDVELRLEDAAEGVRMLEDREVFGKIVVTP